MQKKTASYDYAKLNFSNIIDKTLTPLLEMSLETTLSAPPPCDNSFKYTPGPLILFLMQGFKKSFYKDKKS